MEGVIADHANWNSILTLVALILSIVGSFLGPIITSVITNKHQLKLRELDHKDAIHQQREQIIRDCISGIGACLSCSNPESEKKFGESFHAVYSFVDPKYWYKLDFFYNDMISGQRANARERCSDIIQLLIPLLDQDAAHH